MLSKKQFLELKTEVLYDEATVEDIVKNLNISKEVAEYIVEDWGKDADFLNASFELSNKLFANFASIKLIQEGGLSPEDIVRLSGVLVNEAMELFKAEIEKLEKKL